MKSYGTRKLPHALLVRGALERVQSALATYLGEYGVVLHDATYTRIVRLTRCTIDDVRSLSATISLAPPKSGQVVLVSFETITNEAQHALLKTLEEPPFGTIIILVTPYAASLIPTVRSRLTDIELGGALGTPSEHVNRFISASVPIRLTLVASLIDRKDVSEVREFLEDLEYACALQPDITRYRTLRHIMLVRRYASDRSASLKQLLEHLAVTLTS